MAWRYGAIHRGDPPTPEEPLLVQLPGGSGESFTITEPADQWVQPWAWDILSIVELFEKGVPPVAGGSLDQSAWFIEVASFTLNDINTIKAQNG